MATREHSDQLLRTIDAVLSECSKDPRTRPVRPAARPAWPGPSWLQDGWAGASHGAASVARPPAS